MTTATGSDVIHRFKLRSASSCLEDCFRSHALVGTCEVKKEQSWPFGYDSALALEREKQ